ncbi:MAG: class I SAM-dependent methyltransferase [Thermodesulfobacteriota bacterium]|nr:class I SAM-dependent methyltransferase [Thermodesulfobacteriota bacterium]
MDNFYEKNHHNYFDSTFRIDSNNFLSPLANHLNIGDSILDIGCGSGRDLLWGVQQGYKAVGFEQSPGLAKLARKHSLCTVIEGDFTSYDFSKLRFTALIFVGSLVHLSKEKLPIILKSTCRALVPGGLLFITMKEGDGFSQSDDGRVFTLWSQKDLEQVFANQHLQTLDFSKQTSKIRSDDVWLGYVLRMENAI